MPAELKQVPQPWTPAFFQARRDLESSLFLCSPTAVGVLNLWGEYHNMLLVRPADVCKRPTAFELSIFVKITTTHCDEARDRLNKHWCTEAARLAQLAQKRSPDALTAGALRALAAVMNEQVRQLALTSMHAYADLFLNPRKVHGDHIFPGFVIRAVIADNALTLDPDFTAYENALIGVVDTMLRTVQALPRIEAKLATVPGSEDLMLTPHLDPATVQAVKAQLTDVVKQHRSAPMEYLAAYAPFQDLISGQADADLSIFLSSNRPFIDFTKARQYKSLSLIFLQ
jgi:hypothetical protein